MKTLISSCALAAMLTHDNSFERGRKDAGGSEEVDIKALAAGLKLATDEVKRFAEEADKKVKAGEQLSQESKQKADEALVKLNEIGARMTEAEQKLARRGGDDDGGNRRKSIGEQVTDNEEVKALLASKRGRARVSVKAIISSLTTDANGSAGDLIVPQRQPGIVASPNRRMTIRDLLMPGRTSSNAIQYVKETGFTNNAATVSETSGASKPQSEIKFDLVTAPVTTIAHFVKATVQILDDVPQLQSYVDGRLRYGLDFVEEAQLLMGGGTGTDLNGIYTQATAFSAPFTPADQTMIDTIRLALLQAALAEYPASGIVLSMHDWARIEMTKDGEGRYILGGPGSGAQPLLWRLPVVETQAMTVDKFLVGAFNMAAQIFDREDAHVDISTEDADNFTKNLVTIRAEERLALAVYRPEAFIKGDLGNVP
ncbi:phage major capsid protein [Rhizobium sp. Leaf453]|uniref:phage major capsid protein n=1 Tax=Rhizobium sp. Leaf453 TaxID=1736380 RepID=UPI0009E6904F|nr:phage major capsid protein [Rhizobium sp. Leaf453]